MMGPESKILKRYSRYESTKHGTRRIYPIIEIKRRGQTLEDKMSGLFFYV